MHLQSVSARGFLRSSPGAMLRPILGKAPISPSSTTMRYPLHLTCQRRAWLSTTSSKRAKNQIYAPIRNADSFNTYLSLSTSSRTPLITLWTASWCSTCRVVTPLMRSLIESGVGESHGGVSFATVEFDAPEIMSGGAPNLAMDFMITSIPTLLSFDGGEAQTTTKITDARKMSDRQFLIDWINNEASRHGGRGGGGVMFGGLFGKR